MNYRLVVRPEVDADLLEVEAWYEQQQAGLGREFLPRGPEGDGPSATEPAPLPHPASPHAGALAYPRRFPYRIVFRVIDDTVVIYAVLHSARHDRHWQRRV